MKNRTIEEIHDKHIGHKQFAKFVDLAIERGHQINEIKEYYEKFKFMIDDYPAEYDKTVKFDAKWYLHFIEETLNMRKELMNGNTKL